MYLLAGFEDADSYCHMYNDRLNDRLMSDDPLFSKLIWFVAGVVFGVAVVAVVVVIVFYFARRCYCCK